MIKFGLCQLLLFLFLAVLVSCGRNREESPVIPPVTSPLSREYIGFGVITDSFTHIVSDPARDDEYLGYLRRGSLVRVVRRQSIKAGNNFVSWVLIDGNERGWLKEEVMDIYDNESQAETASQAMSR